jgi:hypothetical protein
MLTRLARVPPRRNHAADEPTHTNHTAWPRWTPTPTPTPKPQTPTPPPPDFSRVICEFDTASAVPPLDLAWCGVDAVAMRWEGLLLLAGPYGDWWAGPGWGLRGAGGLGCWGWGLEG